MSNSDSLKNKGISGVKWNFLGKFSTHFFAFIVTLFLARILTPEDFGLVAMANVFIALTQSFIDFGMASGLVQKKDVTEVQYSTVFFINLLIAILLMLLMILSAELIAKYYNEPKIAPIARFVSYSFVISAFNGVQKAQLIKKMEFKTINVANLIGAVGQGVIGILLAFKGYGVWSIVYSVFIGNILTTIYIWKVSSWRPKWHFNLKKIKSLFDFGYKLFLSSLLNVMYEKLDELIIGRIFNSTTLGYYYRSKSFNRLISSYTSDTLNSVFFSSVSQLQDNLQRVRNLVIDSLEGISFLVFAMVGLMYVNSESLIILTFGKQWYESVNFFKILAFSSYAFPISVILVNVLSGLGYSGKFLKLEIIKKIVGLSAMAIGFWFGIEGYLWALVVASTIGLVINMWYVQQVAELKLKHQVQIVLKYLWIAIVGVLFASLLDKYLDSNLWVYLIINTTVFLIIYLPINFLSKNKGMDMITQIIKKKIFNKN